MRRVLPSDVLEKIEERVKAQPSLCVDEEGIDFIFGGPYFLEHGILIHLFIRICIEFAFAYYGDMKTLEFWFDFASTYSYLTAMRIEKVCSDIGVQISWKPFLLGPLFKEQGWSTSPFNVYPTEGKYMWREMERHSRRNGLVNYRKPSTFPRNSLLAARIGVAAEDQIWLGDFVRAVFQAEFEQDRDIGETAVIGEVLQKLGVSPEVWLKKANSEESKLALRSRTGEAKRKEIFGAPSFIARGELFWGNDRLEEACEYLE